MCACRNTGAGLPERDCSVFVQGLMPAPDAPQIQPIAQPLPAVPVFGRARRHRSEQ